ncbi:MAG TPA: integrin alpha, partial [Allosphingosinicella sp.]|nr:integrin alpha [Allosphingosinicella sp.]
MADFPATIDLSTAGAAVIVMGGEGNDKAGASVSEAGDVNGDGIGDFIVGAPYGSTAVQYAGAAYVIFGKAGGLPPSIDLATPLAAADGFAIQNDAAHDHLGFSVSGAGDYNGDGFADLIVGERYGDNAGDNAGKSYVVFGKASGFATIDLAGADAGDDFIILQGDDTGDQLGTSVSFAGDVNGDGLDDLVIGAPRGEDDIYNSGQAYVIFGKPAGSETDIDLDDDDVGGPIAAADGYVIGIGSSSSYDSFGQAVSGAGDVNGDGFDDIIVGAPQADFGNGDRGAAYVIFGTDQGFAGITPAMFDPSDAGYDPSVGFAIRGDAGSDLLGKSVSGAGDVNGDGYDDVIVGVYSGSDGGPSAGEAYVIFGKPSGFGEIELGTPIAATDGFHILGAFDFDRFGMSVSDAGDINGDGFDDIIIGATQEDSGGLGAGAAYVIFGKVDGFGTIDLDTPLNGTNGFKIQGDVTGDSAGRSVSSAGDVNGDGFDDIMVGAHYGDDGGGYAGEAYIIYGRAPTTAVTRTGSAGDQTIRGGAFDDDLFGLGGADRLIGSGGHDRLDGGAGIDRMFGGTGN